jgi:hypothetical protein
MAAITSDRTRSSAATRYADFLNSIRCLVRRVLGPQSYRQDTLPPTQPILWVEEIHEGTTKRGGDDDVSHSSHPIRAATSGPVPSPKTALHASNQGSHRLSSLGYSASNLESGVTILSPKRAHPPAAILASLRIQEINSRSAQGGADCNSFHLNTPPYLSVTPFRT